MNSLFIAHRPGRTTDESLIRSCRWHRVTDVLPMSVTFPPLDIRIQAIQALALLLRRCRATDYTSSAVPRFTGLFSNRYMLLSPFPFRSRLVVHLGVIYPELRPPLVAILSVRDTAHTFALIRLLSTQAIIISTITTEPSNRYGLADAFLVYSLSLRENPCV